MTERKVFLSKEDRTLICKIHLIKNCETVSNKLVTVGMAEYPYLITEAVNLAFLRFITLRRKTGGIELLSMARSGKIIKMRYVSYLRPPKKCFGSCISHKQTNP